MWNVQNEVNTMITVTPVLLGIVFLIPLGFALALSKLDEYFNN